MEIEIQGRGVANICSKANFRSPLCNLIFLYLQDSRICIICMRVFSILMTKYTVCGLNNFVKDFFVFSSQVTSGRSFTNLIQQETKISSGFYFIFCSQR